MANINQIDPAQITKALTDHQNSLIKLALVLGTLLLSALIFNDYRTKEQALQAQISLAQQKLDVITSRDTAVGDINNFKTSTPKGLNEEDFRTCITTYSKSHHVSIISLSPVETKNMGLYDLTKVHFQAVTGNYKDMVLFIRALEKSVFSLRIDSWSGNMDKEKQQMNFNVEMSTVLIHT